MKCFKLIFIFLFVFIIKTSFAEQNIPTNISDITAPTANAVTDGKVASSTTDIYAQTFNYGTLIASIMDKATITVKNAISPVLTTKGNIVLNLFIVLFIIDSVYTFSKQFIEQNYNGIVSMFIVRAFFGTLVYTLLQNFIILDIISECVNNMFNATSLNLGGNPQLQDWFKDGQTANVLDAVTAPLKSTDFVLQGIWNELMKTDLGTGAGAAMYKLFFLILMLPCTIIMYVIAMKISLSLFLKSIEWAIGTSVSLLGLAGYGSELTKKYASTSLQYLVYTAIDYIGTLFMFITGLNIVNTTLHEFSKSANGTVGLTGIFLCILSFIVFSALVKVGPDIVAGISGGSPSITPGHSSALLSSVGSMGGGAGKMLSGMANTAKGIASGVAKGGVSGFAKSITSGNGIRQSLAKGLINAASGGAKGAFNPLAKTIGSIAQHSLVSHGGHQFNLKNTGLNHVYDKIMKTFDDPKTKSKADKTFEKQNKKQNKIIDNLQNKIMKTSSSINDANQNKDSITSELNELISNNLGGVNNDKILAKNKELTKVNKNIKYLKNSQDKLTKDLSKEIDNIPENHNLTTTGEQPQLTLKKLPKNPKWADLSKLSVYDLEKYYKNK